jgi:hypothetical protein
VWYDEGGGVDVKPLTCDYIETCDEIGCRNQTFSRTSPSYSPWPTWSRSPTLSPTASHTPTATVSAAFPASLSALPSDPLFASLFAGGRHHRLLRAPPPRE